MNLEPFQRELVAVIREEWPEIPAMDVLPRQIYTSVQALRISFVESLRNGVVKLPAVVMKFGREEVSDIGVSSGIYRCPLTVFYIDDASSTQLIVHGKLKSLRDRIDDPSGFFQNFQAPPERGAIDTSDDEEVMSSLVGDSGVKIVAGHVTWPSGLLVFNS